MTTDANPPAAPTATMDEWDTHQAFRNRHLLPEGSEADRTNNVRQEEAKTTPLFSIDVARKLQSYGADDLFPQYGLLGRREKMYDPDIAPDQGQEEPNPASTRLGNDHIMLNMNTPFSAFICGSQGSGKSHTLSCMLESALIPSDLGKMTSQALTAIVFHWDKTGNQPCEAAYLCSAGIPVTVLVSPSNFHEMKDAYSKIPGDKKPVVRPLLLQQSHINQKRMMKLMAADNSGGQSLYMAVVRKTIRQLVSEKGRLEYADFKARLAVHNFDARQRSSLDMRLELLESFLNGLTEGVGIVCYEDRMPDFAATKTGAKNKGKAKKDEKEKMEQEEKTEWVNQQRKKCAARPSNIWACEPGSLTIVDLTDPLLQEAQSACALFDMCLDLFLENQPAGGTMLALDEAHKYMSDEGSSLEFTNSLFDAVRLQRHYGIRVVIATQEPTVSPRLLDLCSMTIVHRFSSPAWLHVLKDHLAGVATTDDQDSQRNVNEIFRTIVNLEAGQALLFSTSALLDSVEEGSSAAGQLPKLAKLGLRYVKMRVRQRMTEDGGRSRQVVSRVTGAGADNTQNQ
ncbi:MAG: hypothetical protein Q9207_005909 [Kuettlingeria erythrocarpa]